MAQPRDRKGRFASTGGGLAIASVLALAIAAAPGGGASLGSGGGTVGRPGSSSSSTARARDRNPAPVLRRLTDRGLDVRERDTAADADCAEHSYGEVRRWFRDHPCDALIRASFAVRATGGQTVLVAVAWVDMPTEALAREYHDLVDGDGTGNVTELTRERGRYTGVRFTGEHYESARDGESVVNVQAQPVGAGVGADELEDIVRTALG